MMKKTQRKDAIRNIRKQFISFLSIMIVVSLGVGIFLSCRFGAKAISNKGTDVYNSYAFRDIEIRGTRGVTEADIEEIRALDGIADAEGVFLRELPVESATDRVMGRVVTQTERVNRTELLEGEMPQGRNECVVEPEILDQLDLAIGDTLVIGDGDADGKADFLYGDKFRITGTVRHPEHLHRHTDVMYNIVLPDEAIDTDAAGITYTGAMVLADARDLNTFSDDYKARIEEVTMRLATLGRERSEINDKEIADKANEKIAEGEAELASGKDALDAGRAELDENKEKLDAAGTEIARVRDKIAQGEIDLETAKKELETNKKKLDDAKKQLDAAYAELTSGAARLDAGEAELANARQQLDAARPQLDAAAEEIEANQRELDAAGTKLEVARTALDAAKQELNDGRDQINAQIDEVWLDLKLDERGFDRPHMIDLSALTENYTLSFRESFIKHGLGVGIAQADMEAAYAELETHPLWTYYESLYDRIPNGEKEYASGLAQYESGAQQLADARKQYTQKQNEYNDGLIAYEEGVAAFEARQSEYNTGLKLYEANRASYEDGLAQYAAGQKAYEDAQKEYDDGKAQFASKEKEYEDGQAQLAEGEETWKKESEKYEEGAAELEAGREALAKYGSGSWILLDRDQNLSWHEMAETHRTFRNIGWTFAMLFVLLGALVCYATIGKIIDEQRTLVGTTKALGFTSREIFGKYLLFGGIAAICGSIMGILLGTIVLQQLIATEVGKAYKIEGIPLSFSLLPAIISILISLGVAAFATKSACGRLLAEPARRLMSGEIPPTFVKRDNGKEPKKTSLYRDLIFRNIRTDLKRVIITVVSIAGSCILLIVGFSMRDSFTEVIDRQYEQILAHDVIVKYQPERTETVREDVRDILRGADVESTGVYTFGAILRVGAEQEMANVVAGDPDALMQFYHLRDWGRGARMRIPDEGAVIFCRLAEVYDLQVGDHISILDELGEFHDVPVAGIYNSFAGRDIFLSEKYAAKLFGDGSTVGNGFVVRLNGADREALQEELRGVTGFLQITDHRNAREQYLRTAKSLDIVILVMILMAGIMAAVVLLNLIRIQLNQKKRELTIMRVNGFTTRETVLYILRENIITTIAGIALGIFAGNAIAQICLRTVERVETQMIRTPDVSGCIYSALLTLLFAAVINFFALRKIKDLKLSDVNG